jgi:hypothetical protein
MVFQVVAPKQLRDFERDRLQFLYQAPKTFMRLNQPDLTAQIKSPAGFAKAAASNYVARLRALCSPSNWNQWRRANHSRYPRKGRA